MDQIAKLIGVLSQPCNDLSWRPDYHKATIGAFGVETRPILAHESFAFCPRLVREPLVTHYELAPNEGPNDRLIVGEDWRGLLALPG